MRYFASSMLVVFVLSLSIAAQDDHKKAEVFVGYSFGLVDDKYDTGSSIGSFFNDRSPRHGFNTSAVYNKSKYFGIKGDISGTWLRDNFRKEYRIDNVTAVASGKKNATLYNFLGGVQVKNNASTKRFRPFGHAMVGVGSHESSTVNANCFYLCDTEAPRYVEQSTGLAGAFGGGLDIKVNEKIQVRAIQLDYNPMKLDRMKHNGRVSVGLVF